MPKSKTIESKRVIRRYANRRLYDVETSAYVNLDDLKELVLKGIDFVVVVDKTGDDVTFSVLKHIFLDLELKGTPIFSEQTLKNLILMGNTFHRDNLKNYLSYYFKMFSPSEER
jgi:polyhydroxyalkanoate synthesis repressor PhaR